MRATHVTLLRSGELLVQARGDTNPNSNRVARSRGPWQRRV